MNLLVRSGLADPKTTFLDAPLDWVIDRWREDVKDSAVRDWLDACHLRHLDLDASATARTDHAEGR